MGSLGRFLAASVTTTEAIKRELQPEVTGAIAAPTPTDHRTPYPGGGASKTIMAAASPIFRPARQANNHESRADEQTNGGYARDLDSRITAAAIPHVALEGVIPPPTQDTPRVVASYPAPPKGKRGWRRRARDNANLRSRLRSSPFCRLGVV